LFQVLESLLQALSYNNLDLYHYIAMYFR
jgi:hypothetical protein